MPHDGNRWGWACGFYPGLHPREYTQDAAANFDAADDGFLRDWKAFLAKRAPVDFDEWRSQQAATPWKYAMWNAGCRMPTQTKDGWTTCLFGEKIDGKTTSDHIRACHMIQERERKGPRWRTGLRVGRRPSSL